MYCVVCSAPKTGIAGRSYMPLAQGHVPNLTARSLVCFKACDGVREVHRELVRVEDSEPCVGFVCVLGPRGRGGGARPLVTFEVRGPARVPVPVVGGCATRVPPDRAAALRDGCIEHLLPLNGAYGALSTCSRYSKQPFEHHTHHFTPHAYGRSHV